MRARGTHGSGTSSIGDALRAGQRSRGLARLEVAWGYRRTDLPARGIIVEASLALEPGDRDQIRRTMEASLRRRKRTHR